MELKDLLLKKEELPILNDICFWVPIHPRLLEDNITLNKNLGKEIFEKAANDWYHDLNGYVKGKNSEHSQWIKDIFLKERPSIRNYGNYKKMFQIWRNDAFTNNRGFITSFTLNRNEGGTIYFNKNDADCKISLMRPYINFSDEKLKEFEFKKRGNSPIGYTYAHHNINHYPGALFLRNWAIMYMNEVFKEIF